jgi:dolichol-phosphate mannosyltransferase
VDWDKIPYVATEFFTRRTRACFCVIATNEGKRLKGQLARMQSRAHLADIIVVDLQSTDDSTEPGFLAGMGVRALLTLTEKGLSIATMAVFSYAAEQGYSGVITVDGNGKDGVEAIEDFIRGLDEGYDLIQGTRFMPGGTHKNTPWDRYMGIRFVIAPLLFFGCGYWYRDPTNGFRSFSMRFLLDERVQPVRKVFVHFGLHHYLLYRAAKLDFKMKQIPVSRTYPADGFIPTKIIRWQTKWLILYELLEAILGWFNPTP